MADRVEHFGSTAVPRLESKPIIDMITSIRSLAVADAYRHALSGAGYNLIAVGFRMGRFFKWSDADASIFHLHLAISPNRPLKNELIFRDWLMAPQPVARAYGALKVELARRWPDEMRR